MTTQNDVNVMTAKIEYEVNMTKTFIEMDRVAGTPEFNAPKWFLKEQKMYIKMLTEIRDDWQETVKEG